MGYDKGIPLKEGATAVLMTMGAQKIVARENARAVTIEFTFSGLKASAHFLKREGTGAAVIRQIGNALHTAIARGEPDAPHT